MADLCETMNKLGKGIGSTPRYRIVEALFSGPKTVGELAEKTKQSQPLVSQPYAFLRRPDWCKTSDKDKKCSIR